MYYNMYSQPMQAPPDAFAGGGQMDGPLGGMRPPNAAGHQPPMQAPLQMFAGGGQMGGPLGPGAGMPRPPNDAGHQPPMQVPPSMFGAPQPHPWAMPQFMPRMGVGFPGGGFPPPPRFPLPQWGGGGMGYPGGPGGPFGSFYSGYQGAQRARMFNPYSLGGLIASPQGPGAQGMPLGGGGPMQPPKAPGMVMPMPGGISFG